MAKRTAFAALLLLTFAVAAFAGAAEVLCTDACCTGAESGPCAPCPCCPSSHALVAVQPEIGPDMGTVADFAVPVIAQPSSPPRGVLHVPRPA